MADSKAGVGFLKFLKAIVWVVYAAATAAIIFIAFAFFMLIFDANRSAAFVEFVYSWGAWFSQPFAGMIEPTKLPSGGVVAWSALFAIAAYAVLAWIVGAILNSISARLYRDTQRTVVGQTTVTETHPLSDGGVVATKTTQAVVAPSPVDQEEANRAVGEAMPQPPAQQAAQQPPAQQAPPSEPPA